MKNFKDNEIEIVVSVASSPLPRMAAKGEELKRDENTERFESSPVSQNLSLQYQNTIIQSQRSHEF